MSFEADSTSATPSAAAEMTPTSPPLVRSTASPAALCGKGAAAAAQPAAAAAAPASPTSSFEDSYDVLGEIGAGTFSRVHKVRHRLSGQLRAAKVVPRDQGGFNADEGRIAQALQHQHIVNTHDVFDDDDRLVVVTELLEGGELFAAVDGSNGLPEAIVRERMAELLDAIEYMHARGVAHRDIKLENLMLSPTAGLKLIDFGYAKSFGEGRPFRTCCGSPNYMAPEILLASRAAHAGGLPTRHGAYGREVDLWAAGVTMFVLLFGQYPFAHERRAVWHKRILNADFVVPADSEASPEALDLLRRLLRVDPNERITAAEARRHAWLQAHPAPSPDVRTPRKLSPTPRLFGQTAAHSADRAQAPVDAPIAESATLFTPPPNRHRLDDPGTPADERARAEAQLPTTEGTAVATADVMARADTW